jgi:hypothetical protein
MARPCCRWPVFVDLVFENHRSRTVGFLTALRPLLALFVGLGAGVVSLPGSCVDALPTPPPGVSAGSVIVFIAAYILAALASHRAHPRRLLAPALVVGVGYVAQQVATELPACARVAGSSIASVRVFLSVADLLFTVVNCACLAWLIAEDPRAALGAPPLIHEAYVPRLPAALARLDAAVAAAGGSAVEPPKNSWSGWARDVARGALVAPLRHHLAITLTLVFVTWAPVGLSLLAASYAGTAAPKGSGLDAVVAAAVDALLAATAGAWLAAAHVAAACAGSYAAVYRDARLIVAARDAAAGGRDGGNGGGGAPDKPARPPPPSPSGGLFAKLTAAGPSPFVGGDAAAALDVGGPLFTYHAASTYIVVFVVTQLTAFALTAVLLAAAAFFLTSRATRAQAAEAGGAFLAAAFWVWLVRRAYARWVTAGPTVLRPRLLVFMDFWLATSFGAAAGLTSGVARFVVGVAHVLTRLTVLSRPIVPAQYAYYDGGFLAYGGMLRAAFATALDEKNVPDDAPPPPGAAAPLDPPAPLPFSGAAALPAAVIVIDEAVKPKPAAAPEVVVAV